MRWVQLGLVGLTLSLCLAFSKTPARLLGRIERALRLCGGRFALACLVVGSLAFGLPALMTAELGLPQPGEQDEFSYVLAGETFAKGRLANPMHPMWEHFESPHIIVHPTYASKYPPAQGLVLATGALLSGWQIVGVWLSAAFASIVVFWMLRAWLPAGWALLGGILFAVHPLALAWSSSYWGGLVPAAGGALVLGAYRRITKRRRVSDGVMLGVGMGILANCRPYEGLGLSLIVSVCLVRSLLRQRADWRGLTLRLVLPVGCVLCATGAWMAYYNLRVTGDALKLPYVLYQEMYSKTPSFIFLDPRPDPPTPHKAIRDLWDWTYTVYLRQQTLQGWLLEWRERALTLTKAYVWPFVLGIPLLAVPAWLRWDHKLTFAVTLCGLFVSFMIPVTWHTSPHYLAPAFGAYMMVLLQSLRHLRLCRWRGMPLGAALTCGVLIIWVAWVGVFWSRYGRYSRGNLQRAGLIRQLGVAGGKHLIVVRYSEHHNTHEEWVYNDADIDAARVVWAREMNTEKDQLMLQFFRDRAAWLLEPDIKPLRLVPLQREEGSAE